MNELFDRKLLGADAHAQFRELCCDSGYEDNKQYIESLWARYEPFADPNFREKFARSTPSRFWEMYLTCTLISLGFQVVPRDQRTGGGPDVMIRGPRQTIWVEAVAAMAGEGPDAVVRSSAAAICPPVKGILLRLTSAVGAKREKYRGYLRDGLVAGEDPYIVAVNGAEVPYSYFDRDDVSYIVQALYGVGSDVMVPIIDWETGEMGVPFREPRPEVKKRSGSGVSTACFVRTCYGGVSAVLYSCVDVYRGDRLPKLGADFVFCHNLNARNALPEGWLRTGREVWVEGNTLMWKEHDC